jgi:hypothetical protein
MRREIQAMQTQADPSVLTFFHWVRCLLTTQRKRFSHTEEIYKEKLRQKTNMWWVLLWAVFQHLVINIFPASLSIIVIFITWYLKIAFLSVTPYDIYMHIFCAMGKSGYTYHFLKRLSLLYVETTHNPPPSFFKSTVYYHHL